MNEKIHFDDFVEQVSLESGFDSDTTKAYVEGLFDTIIEENAKGRWVKFRNFGSFRPRWYKAKRGINPQTKEALDILPHYHINFKSSKDLETILNSEETLNPIALETPANRFMDKLCVILFFIITVWIFKALIIGDEKVVPPVKIPKAVKSVVVAEKEVKKALPQKQEKMPVKEVLEIVVKQEAKVVEEKDTFPSIYEVLYTQTLSHIGRDVYKDRIHWPLIFSENSDKIKDPDMIYHASKLTIPKKRDGRVLHNSYIDVYDAYMNVDKMNRSFWVLCQGAKYIGKDFQKFLIKKLHPMEYKIIKRCVGRN